MERALNSTTPTPSGLVAVETPSAFRRALVFPSADAEWRRLRLVGADGVDLLNRLCASELDFPQMRAVQNGVFTDERGRYLALFTAFKIGENELILACQTADAPKLAEHIAKYTIIEDATLSDCSDEWAQVHLFGNVANSVSAKLQQVRCVLATFPQSTTSQFTNAFFERTKQAEVEKILAKSEFEPASGEIYEQVRVWFGLPVAGRELTDAVNPLEAGFYHLISFTKGCYIGQEVIARLDTYDKVQRQITAFEAGAMLADGAPLESADGVCGFVSSCVQLADGRFIGLGYTKKRLFTHGTNAPLKSGTNALRERALV